MVLSEAIQQYMEHLISRRFVVKSLQNNRARLGHFLREEGDRELESFRPEDLQSYLNTPFLQGLARGTYNHYISAIKKFFQYCHDMGYMTKNPARVLMLVREEQPIIEYLTVDEIRKLFETKIPYEYNRWQYQLRDRLAFQLAIYGGLRSSEIINLKWRDIEWKQKEIFIRRSKNLKDRIIPIASIKLYNSLKLAYWCSKGRNIREPQDLNAYVMPGNRQGKKVQCHTLNVALRKTLALAGVQKKWPHMHMLRHTSATMYHRGKPNHKGMDIKTIQELLGHASIRTTEKYTHVDKSFLREEMMRSTPIR